MDPVIGAHDCIRPAALDRDLEGDQIGLAGCGLADARVQDTSTALPVVQYKVPGGSPQGRSQARRRR